MLQLHSVSPCGTEGYVSLVIFHFGVLKASVLQVYLYCFDMSDMSNRNRKKHHISDSDDDDYMSIKWEISKLKRRLMARDSRSRSNSPSSPCASKTANELEQDVLSLEEFSDDDTHLSVEPANIAVADEGDPINTAAEETSSTLDASILALLGVEQPSPDPFGPEIHVELAKRWSSVLKHGLSEESVNALQRKYPPSRNCKLLKGPRVNPEITVLVNEQVNRRDARLLNLQNQIGAALSALGQLTTALISEKGEARHSYIELASDASKLLLDFHQKYSVTRREMLTLNLRKHLNLVEILTNAPADEWLFGGNLGERMKDIDINGLELQSNKAIKSKNTIRQPPKQPSANSYHPPNRIQKGPNRGGWKNKGLPYPTQQQRNTAVQVHRRRQELDPVYTEDQFP